MVKRILTFITVAPIVFALIILDLPHSGIIPFVVLMAAVGVLATNEYFTFTSRLQGNAYEMIGYVLVLVLILSAYMRETTAFWNSPVALAVSVMVISVFSYELVTGRMFAMQREFFLVIRGVFYIGWLYAYFVLLRNLDQGFAYLLFLVLTIAACDTTAYFIGIKFGSHKIAPRVSPKKSVEGCIAGFLAAVAAAVLLGTHYMGFYHSVVLGTIIGILGQAGDFFESMLKRHYGVKDSGWLLPGHGGVMDRMDSAVFIVPIIYYYIILAVHA